jgi:tricorn protease interacting factor F2/3
LGRSGSQIDSYGLELDVDFEKSRVKGVVDVHVRGVEDPLSLDAVDMRIGRVLVNGNDREFRHDKAKGILTICGVPKKSSVVQVSFDKRVSDEAIVGLYKSKYGKDHLLVTDFEPARARTAFPCKDEPSYKAVFRLSVTTQKGLSVISNTRVASTKDAPRGKTKFVFEPTPRMSTYLFFFGVGRFEEEKKQSGSLSVIAASRPGQSKRTEFAVDTAIALVEEYGRYFSIAYPLPKLHLVALPEYRAGAMENWGTITFREALLLTDSGSSTSDRLGVAHVLAHEIAHQWFGDLVTMKWWDDLWLNESFATFMDHKVLERLHPEWDNWKDFLRGSTFTSMKADALDGTHPIQASVKKVEEIEGVFDEISYGKGASILRMIEAFMGESQFRKGVSSYLRRFGYSNAEGEDLWNSLGKASGLPVSRLARAWITKPGFPVVRVTESKGKTNFRQTRFSLSGKATGGVWPVPLTMAVGGKRQRVLLDRVSSTIRLPSHASLVVNPGRTGFYSVLYDADAYDQIAEGFAKLHSHDRAGILSDLYLFMQAGIVEPQLYFRFVSLCGGLADTMTAEAVTDQLVNLRAIADEAAIVRRGYSWFYESQVEKLGLHRKESEDETTGELREAISSQLAKTSAEFARGLSPQFENYASIEPDLKSAVVVSYAMTGGDAAFDELVARAKAEKSEAERVRIYRALTSVPDPRLVERCLELSVSGEVSRSDSVYAISLASTNPKAREVLWNWLKKRYDLIRDTYGVGTLLSAVNGTVPRCGIGREVEVHRFISGKRYKEGKETFKRTFELLEVNSNLRKRLLAA